ncbi:acyltransferase [Wenzhouxiangella sp. XN79A]|uniref:acyltransferase family protein n=1 Tax=Wenzhouxiangella sp. XN79A TaxID=2724193 RepID=UPI001F10042C|nr:acyltransferase [Wenzhouxiangella sp. XN79A]
MTSDRTSTYVQHIHLLRGVTIAWIVATHATAFPLAVSSIAGQSFPVTAAIQNLLFYQSTVMFALISGLLYSLVLARKPIGEFYRAKALNVLVPYLVVSIPYALLGLSLVEGVQWAAHPTEFLYRYAVGVPTGTTMPVLWYIPVILILFLLTPPAAAVLHSRFGTPFFAAVMLLPLFFPRVWPEFSFNNVAHFGAPYLFGVWLGSAYDARSRILARGFWVFVLTALLISIWAIGDPAGLLPDIPDQWRTQVFYAQKMSLAVLVILMFRRLEHWRCRPLERLGDDAFAIYFLHMFPVFGYGIPLVARGATLTPLEIALHGALLFVAALALSLLMITAIRKMAGPRSRLLVGS